MQGFLPVQVTAVYSGLLRYYDQFLHALLCHVFCLLYELFHGNTAVSASELRDNTVGAVLVTSLCDLQVFIIAAGGDHPLCLHIRQIGGILELQIPLPFKCLVKGLYDIVKAGCPQDSIYFRDLLYNFLLVPLRQTTGHQQDLEGTCLLILCHFQNIGNALLLGIMDEGTGVDNSHISLCLIVYDGIPMLHKHAQHLLRIRQVLVTSKRYK